MNTCSTSQVIREIQINTTVRTHLTSVRTTIIQKKKQNETNKTNKKKNQNSKKTNPRDVLEKMWIKGKGILVGGNVN